MSGRLITDLDVLTGKVGSPIVLGPGDLLTSAARDRAIANGMQVVERDGSVSGAASPASPAPVANPASPAGGCGCGGRAAGCGCPGCSHGGAGAGSSAAARAAPAVELSDGLHLVRVDGGRVQWSRPLAGEAPARPI